jgi:drug/metabolite transporter (DMT)-like permease
MAHQKLSLYQSTILILVSVCAPLGNACLAKGMTSLPALSVAHPIALFAAVFTPWVALGIALLIGFFASYLTALSWADLSYVMLATAWGNVVVELLSRFCLHEPVSWQRWLGVALITLGVGFVAPGPSRTIQPVRNDSELIETLAEKGVSR